MVAGATSQSANLTEWRNVSGTTLASVSSGGRVGIGTGSPSAPLHVVTEASDGSGILVIGPNTTNDPEIAISRSSQARVNLRLRGTAGSAYLSIWDSINGITDKGLIVKANSVGVGGIPVNTSGLFVTTTSASTQPLIVRGFASQTADLQQWQNDSATVLAKVTSSGAFENTGTSFNESNPSFKSTYTGGATFYISPRSGDALLGTSTNHWLYLNTNNAGRISISAGGLVMVNSTSLTSQFGVVSSAAGTVATVIRGAASQTADLLKLQSSTPTDVLRVGPDGRTSILAGSADVFATANATFALNTHSTSAIGIVVRGVSSQSGDLQQWQDNSGTVLAMVRSSGALFAASVNSTLIANSSDSTVSRINLNSTGTVISTATAANVTLTIQNTNATPTGNLTEWKNTGGSVIASIDKDGNASFGSNLIVTGNLTVNGTTTTVNSTTTTLDDPIITLGGDSAPGSDDNKDRGVEFRWHNGTSAKLGFFGFDDSTGKFTFIPDATNTSEVFSGTLGSINVGGAEISVPQTTDIGLIIRGASGQSTESLQEWRSNSDVAQAKIDANGTMTLQALIAQWSIFVSAGSTTTIPIRARGASGQIANLQEWQEHGPFVRSYVDSVGRFRIRSSNTSGSSLVVGPTATTQVPIIAQGLENQSANLQEWQNSTGTPVAIINALGAIRGLVFTDVAATGAYARPNPSGTDSGGFMIQPRASTNMGLIVKGEVSQSADLQQWQNSEGTPLTTINSTGAITAPSASLSTLFVDNIEIDTTGATNNQVLKYNGTKFVPSSDSSDRTSISDAPPSSPQSGDIWFESDTGKSFIYYDSHWVEFGSSPTVANLTAPTSDAVPLSITGASGQTANLTEWRNNSNDILTRIGPDGAISTTGPLKLISSGTEEASLDTISVTIGQNTAVLIDSFIMADYPTIDYVIQIKQGSKIRSSRVLVITDATDIDKTEYAILELGGSISGASVTVSTSGINGLLYVTVTDGATTSAKVTVVKTAIKA